MKGNPSELAIELSYLSRRLFIGRAELAIEAANGAQVYLTVTIPQKITFVKRFLAAILPATMLSVTGAATRVSFGAIGLSRAPWCAVRTSFQLGVSGWRFAGGQDRKRVGWQCKSL